MDQQRPTITDIRIRNTNDAHVIFHAVAERILPMIKRRLDPEERTQVKPGCCYIWEERSADEEAVGMGMERWTDGLSWGPSRTREDFLFYIQKSQDDADASSKGRLKYGKRRRSQPVVRPDATTPSTATITSGLANTTSSSAGSRSPDSPVAIVPSSPSTTYPHFPASSGPAGPSSSSSFTQEDYKLIKQTYSVYTKVPGIKGERKWHLTAYYTPHAVATGQLKDVTQIPELANLVGLVPPGRFRPARIGKRGTTTTATTTTTTTNPASPLDSPASPPIYYYNASGSASGGGMMDVAPTLEPSGSRYVPIAVRGAGPGQPAQHHHHQSHLSWPTIHQQQPAPRSPAYPSSAYSYAAYQQPHLQQASPRHRNHSLPTIAHLQQPASPYQTMSPAPARSYSQPDPNNQMPDSPAGSDDEAMEEDAIYTSGSGGASEGLTTLVENRALPPLDFTTITTAGLPARTAEDERTLWALTKGFNR